MIGECGMLAGTNSIVMQLANAPRGIAEMRLNRSFYGVQSDFKTKSPDPFHSVRHLSVPRLPLLRHFFDTLRFGRGQIVLFRDIF